MKTTASRAFLMIAVVLLTLQFKTHFVPVAGKLWFNTFANKTESFVLGRLAYSEQNGILSEGALLGSSRDTKRTCCIENILHYYCSDDWAFQIEG